jgi:predicted transcriptional regulator
VSFVTVNQLRKALREHRLDKGLTFDELAAQINAAVGAERVSQSSIFRFIENDVEPRDLTAHAIERYLEKVSAEKVA